MPTPKRKPPKAARYGALREELPTRLRVVLASRMAQMDQDSSATAAQIAALTLQIDAQTTNIEAMDAQHSEGVRSGYTLDEQIRESGTQANQAAVELERIAARSASNADRIAELTSRLATGAEELSQAQAQLASLAGDLEQQRSFVENATTEPTESREAAQHPQPQPQTAVHSPPHP